ncbi:MAG: TolC family protein [Gammaproteobacteria bacterium]
MSFLSTAALRSLLSVPFPAALLAGAICTLLLTTGCTEPSARLPAPDWTPIAPGLSDAGLRPPPWAGTRIPEPERPGWPVNATLDDCIVFAMQNSPALETAFYRWRAAVEGVPQARSLPDPELGFAIVLDQVDRDTEYMGERYSISQMFPWFGKLALRGDIATEAARAEARRYEAARLALIERVTNAWFEYAWLQAAVTTARENRELLLRLESVARSMYRAGTVSQADVNRAQIELGRLDDQLRSMMDMLGPAAAELNAVLGRPAHAPLPTEPAAPSQQAVADLPARDDEAWLALARQLNPELAASRHAVARERRSVELARREYYPDIKLGLEYARDGSARMARMDGGGADMLVGGVSVNVPIRRSRYDAGVREASARLAEASHQVHEQGNALEAELKAALFAYRDSQRKLQLYAGTLVPKARQSLAVTEAAYRTAEAGFSDLIDTQRVLLEFQLAHERAAADRAQARARIGALAGDPSTGLKP